MPSVLPNAVRIVISVLLGMLLFVCVCVFIVLILLRSVNITDIVQSIDVTTILEETGIYEEIIDEVNEILQEKLDISVQDIEDFVKRDSISGEIEDFIGGYMQAITEGNMGYYVSADDIIDIARRVAPDVSEQFNYELTEQDFEAITKILEEDIELARLSIGSIMDEVNVDVSTVFIVFSIYLPLAVCTLCVILLFNIFMLHRKTIANAFLTASIPIALSGFVFVIAGLLIGQFLVFLSAALRNIIKFAGGFAQPILISGVVCLAAGILLLAAFIVIKVRAEKRPTTKPGDIIIALENKSKVWLLTGLIVNFILVAIFAAFTVLSIETLI